MQPSRPDLVRDSVSGQPEIEIQGVSFEYPNGVRALDRLDLTVLTGERVAVAGPSGCGKSTLLQLLAGLREPTHGSIRWAPPPGNIHPRTMMFQADTLLPWLTAAENVGLHFKFRRDHSRAYVKGYVRELLSLVDLDAFADAYPYELSGGMRRRVALMTAVAPKPRALLLDEPFSSLDEPTRVAIHQDLLTITRDLNMTVVLITHDLAEAISISETVHILTRGPGRVLKSYSVPFPKERNVLELRRAPEFLELYATLWGALASQIAHKSTDGAQPPPSQGAK